LRALSKGESAEIIVVGLGKTSTVPREFAVKHAEQDRAFMKKSYPDVSELFKLKEEWHRKQAERPIEEKLEVAKRLKELSERIRKSNDQKTSGRS
jgi:hypothetical protein